MIKLIFLFVLNIFFTNILYSQKTIEMVEINGVYQIPCRVNGVPMNFIFDTGASEVTISLTEAKFLIKQGLLQKEDFIETVNYQIANGDIIEGTKIILKTIDIDGLILENITASIVHKQDSPLLLGQSAISKLGQYSIDHNKLIINNLENDKRSISPNLKEMEAIVEWLNNMLKNYSYYDNNLKIEYYLKLFKSAGGNYSIGGLRSLESGESSKKDELFLIPINNIMKVDIMKDSKNENLFHLLLLGNSDHKTFITSETTMSSFYSFQLNSTIFASKLDERFTKAFNDLIKHDLELTQATQKY